MIRWLFLVLVGCGRLGFDGHVDSAPAATTRLHEVFNVYENGPRIVDHYNDSLLDLACDVYPTTSGPRCLPRNIAFTHYLDAACTEAVMQVPMCSPDVQYAFDSQHQPIDRIYTAGADIATPTQTYMIGADGSCIAESAPSGMWRALTPASFDTFAQLTQVHGSEGRLVSEQLVAPDGFTTSGALYDTLLGANCNAVQYDDAGVCEPYPLALAYFYTDATCSHLVINAIVPVSFGEELVNVPACASTDVAVHAVTAKLTPPSSIWLRIPGDTSCVLSAPSPGYEVLDLGPPLALASLVRQRVTTGQRIEAYEGVAGGATAIQPISLYDTQLMTECQPQLATDGMLRCLPYPPVGFNPGLFSDAGCTMPLNVVGDNRGCPNQTPLQFAVDFAASAGCTFGGERIYPVGAKYTGPFYSGTPQNCQPTTPNLAQYLLGPELPPSTFSLVTQQTGS